MPTIQPIDILVVGAGPAGSRAAAAAAREGAAALLVDTKSRIGEQPHCGEYVPARLFAEANLDRSTAMQPVDYMETRVVGSRQPSLEVRSDSPGNDGCSKRTTEPDPTVKETLTVTTSSFPGFIIDRVRFDRDLARAAAAQGATVLCSTRLVRREHDAWILKSGKDEMTVTPRFVIAADGAASTVAALLGLAPPDYLRGVQAEVPLTRPLKGTLIFLDRDFVGGYGWLFPKGATANVGLGVAVAHDAHPGALLEELLGRLLQEGLISPGKLARSSGLIPVSGMRPELTRGNVILCGDAAGLTHPITGAGIPQAIFSGDLAGRYAVEALRKGNQQPLDEYGEEVRSWYGGVIGHAAAKRGVMMQLWRHEDFPRVCEETWIGFKGYKSRVSGGKRRSRG
ncbi:MAG: NAD(P)/FAD-dependent oxidoreductase [Desulfomonile tiedjei]|nr:NAD(P)/FAD-dependent oxidoreductase [Desulfomonile tiedjei]